MKKKKAAVIGIAMLVAAGGITATGFYFDQQKSGEVQMPQLPQGMSLSENAVLAAGLTSVGMMEEAWELGFLEDGLYVEETYLNIGDEVEAGAPVFKVTEESLNAARRKLEKKAQEAVLKRRQGEITYQTGQLEAKKALELAAVEASYAQAVYDSAVRTAEEELEKAREEADEAGEKVEEYTASIEADYYYTYYQVGEREATWKDNAAFLAELYEQWDVDSLESVFGGSGGKNGIGYVTNQVTKSTTGSLEAAKTASGEKEGSANQSAGDAEIPAGDFFSLETVVWPVTIEENPEETESGTDKEPSETEEGTEESAEENTEESTPESTESSAEETKEENDGESNQNAPSGGFHSGGFSEADGMADGKGAGGPASVNVGSDEIKYNIYLAMEEEVKESKEAYETALENYEDAKAKAQAGIEKAKSELAVLTAKLSEQEIAFEKAKLEAKKAYDLSVSDQENAQMVYDTAVKQLEEDYDSLKEEEETAAEHLALFEKTIGDGIFYTGAKGTVVMNSVRAGNWLTEDTTVLAYSNPETVSAAASVEQGDIASISIGEETYVVISGYGNFEGKVTSLNPVSSAKGSSKVTYTVNVRLDGDLSGLESDLTAYIYFGLTQEEKEMLERSAGNGERNENMSETGMPGAPEDGMDEKNLPEGMQNGEMPDGQQPSGFSGKEMPEGMENRGEGGSKGGGR